MGERHQLTEYFRALQQHLKCPRHHQRRFLTEARAMVDDFRHGNPDAATQDILDFLGDPKELAQTYLETLDPAVLNRYRNWNRWIRRGCACAVATVICVLAGLCIYMGTATFPVEITATETLIIYRDYGGFA